MVFSRRVLVDIESLSGGDIETPSCLLRCLLAMAPGIQYNQSMKDYNSRLMLKNTNLNEGVVDIYNVHMQKCYYVIILRVSVSRHRRAFPVSLLGGFHFDFEKSKLVLERMSGST